jgi:hypothetical protein
MDASRGAAMLCVGSIGLGRVGSTAATLVARAHCPVAMIRGHGGATSSKPGWVVVEVDESVDSSVLQLGVEEAQLRGAPLRAITAWRSRFTDIHDVRAASEGNRQVRATLIAAWLAGGDAIPILTCARWPFTAAPSTIWPSMCRHSAGRGGL